MREPVPAQIYSSRLQGIRTLLNSPIQRKIALYRQILGLSQRRALP